MSRMSSDIIFIDSTKQDDKVNLWCSVCNYFLIGAEDIASEKKNGCCEECWLTFGQSRKEDWRKGWRPDKDTLKRYKQERSILNVKLKDIIGD